MQDARYPYEAFIRTLPVKSQYTKEDLLVENLLLAKDGPVEMYYAPHNEYVNRQAKVVLVGITPGWTQMELAYRTLIQSMQTGMTYEEACKEAKMAARFAGSMRINLITMLESLGVHLRLGLDKAEDLFDTQCSLLHTTSLLKHPVFVFGQNYNGHRPPLISNDFLYKKAADSFPEEIGLLDDPLIIPLGKSVELMLRQLTEQFNGIPGKFVWGFPHPSGANGHRLKQFESATPAMIQMLDQWKNI